MHSEGRHSDSAVAKMLKALCSPHVGLFAFQRPWKQYGSNRASKAANLAHPAQSIRSVIYVRSSKRSLRNGAACKNSSLIADGQAARSSARSSSNLRLKANPEVASQSPSISQLIWQNAVYSGSGAELTTLPSRRRSPNKTMRQAQRYSEFGNFAGETRLGLLCLPRSISRITAGSSNCRR